MKYSLPKKIIYSIIVAVLLVGLVLTAFFGLNGKGYGSTYDIDLGLDLAGGVSITYQIKEDNFTSQDVEDTIYKLQKRVEGKSTESQVYKEGDNRITVEIPGVTDANEILKELGTPGSLEFLDSTGYTAFSQGNDYTPLLTGSDVKAAQAYTDTNSTDDTPYGVQLTFTDDGANKFYDATSANIGNRIYIVYDGEVVSAPNVKTAISGGTATITGMESFDEADNLATYIRVGSIPLTLEEVSSNIVGAQLGHAAIKTSLIAAAIGLALLCLFMIVMFRIPGLVATLSLIICIFFPACILSVRISTHLSASFNKCGECISSTVPLRYIFICSSVSNPLLRIILAITWSMPNLSPIALKSAFLVYTLQLLFTLFSLFHY